MDLTKENHTNNKVSDNRMAIAIDLMQEGYMCSESVVMAYAEKFGLERELAARITGGFAGGMAQGKTCGALSGAVMVLGLKYGMGVVRNQYAKDLCFQMTQELFHRFETRCQTTECRQIQLLNHFDPKDPELSQKLRQSGLCLTIVQNTLEILEELFREEGC